ncbi:unnamed protein product [Sphagnum compactum]
MTIPRESRPRRSARPLICMYSPELSHLKSVLANFLALVNTPETIAQPQHAIKCSHDWVRRQGLVTSGMKDSLRIMEQEGNKQKQISKEQDGANKKEDVKPQEQKIPTPIHEEEPAEEPWLFVGLQVRIKNYELSGGRYGGRMGVVRKVVDTWAGEIQLLDSKDVILVDQQDCSTVVYVDATVRILGTGHASRLAKVLRILSSGTSSKPEDVELELPQGSSDQQYLILPSNCISVNSPAKLPPSTN